MAQYIDKSAVVAEIEARYNECLKRAKIIDAEYWNGKADAYRDIQVVLDTLEVKEVDLEDNIKETLAQKYIDYTFKRHNIDPESKEGQLIYYAYIHGMNQCLSQLKAQKGNNMMTVKQCWELYCTALHTIEECVGEPLNFKTGCGGDVLNAMMERARQLGL